MIRSNYQGYIFQILFLKNLIISLDYHPQISTKTNTLWKFLLFSFSLLTFVPNLSFSIHESGFSPSNSNTINSPEINISNTLEEIEQRKQQELANRTLMRGQQEWSTYEDPLIGIQFEHPSWWKATQEEDLVKFYMLTNPMI